MSHVFNAWNGLGSALEDANREWATKLMPDFIADVAARLALAYPTLDPKEFESRMVKELYLAEPTLDENEIHAAKYTIGKIFGENSKDRRKFDRREHAMRDEIPFAPRD
jgi:hypothetical protein